MNTQAENTKHTPDWMVIRRPGSPVLFLICMLTVVAIGWGEDRRSCERQIEPRSQGAIRAVILQDFLKTAAQTRFASASHETGIQKQIDLRAAHRYLADALKIEQVPQPQCDKILPDT
jgi:hypothetical protein